MTPCEICPRKGDGTTCLAITSRCPTVCERVKAGHEGYIALVKRGGGEPAKAAEPPGLLRRAATFAGALASHVAAGCPRADEETAARREAICRACPHLDDLLGICNLCGCHLKIKTAWALSECPDKPPRWGPSTGDRP